MQWGGDNHINFDFPFGPTKLGGYVMIFKGVMFRFWMFFVLVSTIHLTNPMTSSGQPGADFLYAGDQKTPYFSNCNVQLLKSSAGIATTFWAEVFDPNGDLPATIRELRVIYPGWSSDLFFTSSDYIGSNMYFRSVSGQKPAIGEYTFIVTDAEGRTATTYFYYGGGAELPVLDSSALRATGGESGVTLSWAGLAGYQGNVFYRARIFGQAGNTIWTSWFMPDTSVSIPGDIIRLVEQDPGPAWRVEAFDNHSFSTSYNRSVSDTVNGILDDSSPYFKSALVYGRTNAAGEVFTAFEINLADPNGTLPGSITSIAVDGPGGFNRTLASSHYLPAWGIYWMTVPGLPTEGVYRFTATDIEGKQAIAHDYVKPVNLPVVALTTMQASGNPLTPTLSWGVPSGTDRTLYFRVIIEDMSGNRIWGSWRTSLTYIDVPSGTLHAGGTYQWHLRTTDDSRWGHYNQETLSDKKVLSIDNQTPWFQWAAVYKLQGVNGFFTAVDASVRDPNGDLPSSLQSITVSGPGGFSLNLLDQEYSYVPVWNEFYFQLPGRPQAGVYTFRARDVEGREAITREYVGDAADMPLVDAASIRVSGDLLAPTVSWSAVSGFPGNVYYRLRLRDVMGNSIYSSSRDPMTAQTIPVGRIEPGKKYTVSVEAQDHPEWVTYNTRSNTPYVWMHSKPATPAAWMLLLLE
jgi:hypothetical protein